MADRHHREALLNETKDIQMSQSCHGYGIGECYPTTTTNPTTTSTTSPPLTQHPNTGSSPGLLVAAGVVCIILGFCLWYGARKMFGPFWDH